MVIHLLLFSSVEAQETAESLTDDFSSLSAKARTRMAKKEAIGSASDVQFQKLMSSADSLFQIGEYSASIDAYEQARTRRPLNVHPKVKIQDLQALLDSEEGMNGELVGKEDEIPLQISDLNAPIQEERVQEKVENVPLDEKKPDPKAVDETITEITTPSALPATLQDPSNDLVKVQRSLPLPTNEQTETKLVAAPKNDLDLKQEATKDFEPISTPYTTDTKVPEPRLEDSVEKEVYKEANAVITKLSVVRNGNLDIYKKVHHQWGFIFYFKNGSSITERMWTDETITFY